MNEGDNTYRTEVIDPGDQASQIAREVCFSSHNNCPALTVIPHTPGNFRGAVSFLWKQHVLADMMRSSCKDGQVSDWYMAESIENDGAGSKPSFSVLARTESALINLPWEIITMTADDFARTGRLPCVLSNIVDVKRITSENLPLFRIMMEGFQKHLKESNLVNITGETAIMKFSITSPFDNGSDEQLILNWGASCSGLTCKDLLIDGSGIEPGQVVVGFWEEGYRCNGGTFLINLINNIWGDDKWTSIEARKFADSLTTPSHSYAKLVCKLIGWHEDGSIGTPLAQITGIAHITGGGLWGKFGEILPTGVGAELDSMMKPAECLLQAQRLSLETDSLLSDWGAYDTFHGGCGMMVICKDLESSQTIIQEASKAGVVARAVGHTTSSSTGEISVLSQFGDHTDEFIFKSKPF